MPFGDMRWQRGRSSGNTIDARGSSGGRGSNSRVAIPSGLGLVGVIVFVAFQLLSGGSGFAVPSAFDDGTQAPDGGAIPAEAIRASQAVGDDRLQRRSGGSVRPDSFTHGTSEQRARWFTAGQTSGEPADCDTFSVDEV